MNRETAKGLLFSVAVVAWLALQQFAIEQLAGPLWGLPLGVALGFGEGLIVWSWLLRRMR